MDTTASEIQFDAHGKCSFCHSYETQKRHQWLPNAQGKALLDAAAVRIKESGRKKEYDCLLGLSGGLDSSYLALLTRELGLRPLVLHVDTGWNSELAVINIQNICSSKCKSN